MDTNEKNGYELRWRKLLRRYMNLYRHDPVGEAITIKWGKPFCSSNMAINKRRIY